MVGPRFDACRLAAEDNSWLLILLNNSVQVEYYYNMLFDGNSQEINSIIPGRETFKSAVTLQEETTLPITDKLIQNQIYS